MIYRHDEPLSRVAKRDAYILKRIGANRKLILELQAGRFINKHPAFIRRKFKKEFSISIDQIGKRKIFTWAPKTGKTGKVVFYLHGGAYVHNILLVHWNMIAELIRQTKATFIIPDYPLAPESNYTEAYEMIEAVYDDLTASPIEELIFMGDSAGGGLALGLAQKLRIDGRKLPDQLILLSPWLDITMTDPKSREVQGSDILLKISGLVQAGLVWAGGEDPWHPMISPLNGSFEDLPPISFFSSTNDILIADAHRLMEILESKNIPFNYYEYPGMFHGWMAIVNMPEAKHALGQIADLINK